MATKTNKEVGGMKPETYRRLVIAVVSAIPMDLDEETALWWIQNPRTFRLMQYEGYMLQEADRDHASLMDKLDTSLSALDFGKNFKYNTFSGVNLYYVGELVQMTPEDLLKLPGFGKKVVERTIEVLNTLGLSLGMSVRGWTRLR